MSKVYIQADGVTVKDDSEGTCFISRQFKDGVYLTDSEARAAVEGLLRRMLEKDPIGAETVIRNARWEAGR